MRVNTKYYYHGETLYQYIQKNYMEHLENMENVRKLVDNIRKYIQCRLASHPYENVDVIIDDYMKYHVNNYIAGIRQTNEVKYYYQGEVLYQYLKATYKEQLKSPHDVKKLTDTIRKYIKKQLQENPNLDVTNIIEDYLGNRLEQYFDYDKRRVYYHGMLLSDYLKEKYIFLTTKELSNLQRNIRNFIKRHSKKNENKEELISQYLLKYDTEKVEVLKLCQDYLHNDRELLLQLLDLEKFFFVRNNILPTASNLNLEARITSLFEYLKSNNQIYLIEQLYWKQHTHHPQYLEKVIADKNFNKNSINAIMHRGYSLYSAMLMMNQCSKYDYGTKSYIYNEWYILSELNKMQDINNYNLHTMILFVQLGIEKYINYLIDYCVKVYDLDNQREYLYDIIYQLVGTYSICDINQIRYVKMFGEEIMKIKEANNQKTR